jgi:hypothetical protein
VRFARCQSRRLIAGASSVSNAVSSVVMKLPRLGIRTRLRSTAGAVADLRYRPAVWRLGRDQPPEYREYLGLQLRRTLSKRDNDPGSGARALVRKVVELGGLSRVSSVLSVGSRNAIELGLFAAAGVRSSESICSRWRPTSSSWTCTP